MSGEIKTDRNPAGANNILAWFPAAVVFIVIAWSIIIAPSFMNAQWGHLDDGADIMLAQGGIVSALNFDQGRTFVGYRLHNLFLYKMGGLDPNIWFFVQSLELLMALLFILVSLYMISNSLIPASAAALLFITSSPVAEAYYTLSKQEPVLVFLCATILLLFSCHLKAVQNNITGTAFFLSSLLLAVIIVFTKETGFLFMFIWAPSLILLTRSGFRQKDVLYSHYLIAFAVSLLVWLYFKINYASLQQNDYTRFVPFKAAYWNALHYVTQSADVLILMALSFLACISWIYSNGLRSIVSGISRVPVMLGIGTFLSGSAYLVVLLAWNQGHSYYMLPVSMMYCISLALFLWLLFKEKPRRKIYFVLFAMIVILFSRFFSLPFIHNMAMGQKDYDRLEASIRSYLHDYRPPNNRLLDTDWHYFEEPPFGNTMLLKIDGLKDIRWLGTAGLFTSYNDERGNYANREKNPLDDDPVNEKDVLLFSFARNPLPIVFRGMLFPNDDEMNRRKQLLENATGWKLIEIKRWEVQRPVYLPWSFRRRPFFIGKVLYEIDRTVARSRVSFSWSGIYSDNYTAKKAILRITAGKSAESGTLRISIRQIPDILDKILPIVVDLSGKKKISVSLSVTALEKDIPVSSLLPDGNGEIRLTVRNPWVPSKVNPASLDSRVLGVEVKYIPTGVLTGKTL
jgi:hypothetical protein